MTVVTKQMNAKAEARQDGRLFIDTGSWKFANADAGIAFIVGDYSYVMRFPLDVPQGATITLAQFVFEYTQKDGAPAQTANLSLYFEQADNSAPWPYTNATVVTGSPSFFPRPLSTAQTFVISYPGGSTPGADLVTQTVTSQIQTLVNRAGWEAGNYITLAMLCTAEGTSSDLSIQTREGASAPTIKVTYTYDDETVARTDVNLLTNQTLANTDDVFNNSLFGLTMDGTTYATNPTGGRDGGPCLQVTAHPPAGQENRYCSALQACDGVGSETYVLSGWFYNPNPAIFSAEFPFQGGRRDYVEKNRWTPFSTVPFTTPAGGVGLFCTCSLIGNPVTVTEGQWFLLDDLCLTRTSISELPWTGATADKFNADYAVKETTTHGVTVRRSRARTQVLVSGTSRGRRNYVRVDGGLWVRADQARTITWDNFGAVAWDSMASSTTTWDTVG